MRQYCKYPISYRNLAEVLEERVVVVDPSTLFCWVQRFRLEPEQRMRKIQGWLTLDWHLDETYIGVGGHWH